MWVLFCFNKTARFVQKSQKRGLLLFFFLFAILNSAKKNYTSYYKKSDKEWRIWSI